MSRGRLILVVGPSGAGKDTLMDGARAALADDPDFVFAQRCITRPADAGGEDHLAVSVDEFRRMTDAGGFMLHWRAHGLHYGLPSALESDLDAGRTVIANVSRGVLKEATDRYPGTRVLLITAQPEVLAKRLAERGRESEEDIRARLSREAVVADGLDITPVINDGTVEQGVAKVLAMLRGEPT